MVLAFLVSLLVFQLAKPGVRVNRPNPPVVALLQSDTHLRSVGNGVLSGIKVGGCLPLYFVDPGCPACRELVARWDAQGRPKSLWIVSGARDVAAGFVSISEFKFGEYHILDSGPTPMTRLADIGIHAAPSSAVLDGHGVVRHLRGGGNLVPATALEKYCQ